MRCSSWPRRSSPPGSCFCFSTPRSSSPFSSSSTPAVSSRSWSSRSCSPSSSSASASGRRAAGSSTGPSWPLPSSSAFSASSSARPGPPPPPPPTGPPTPPPPPRGPSPPPSSLSPRCPLPRSAGPPPSPPPQTAAPAPARPARAPPSPAFVTLAGPPGPRRRGRAAGGLSILAVAVALYRALPVWAGGGRGEATWAWIPADGGPIATVGVLVDELSAAMLVLVTLVSLLVQIYSLSYLDRETPPALGRYYTYQSLFAFSMLGLVLSPSFLQMFIFWELVGLCSYLLIGYWYDRPSAARAAVKAFWITKLGALGFVVGIVMLWASTGTFEFGALFRMAAERTLPAAGLGLIMVLIYLGAVGKSAQFPLHVWLPDAMEGPTPVSALIHAATMVTAGVFMVTRAMPLFRLVPDVLALIEDARG